MESLLIWGGTILFILLIFIPYFIKFRQKQKADFVRKQEAERLGADRAVAQFPQIDPLSCIGCGSCVKACPEGDVLGIVLGKATVINGLKCVGHAKCQEACPVGAIVVGLGDISGRDDIPFMDNNNQTNIPGLYIAGELGGLALLKNAISQGKKVMEHIALSTKRSDTPDIFDVIIVGAGPAGISASLSALENKMTHLLIDQQDMGGTILQYPRKKLVMTKPVEIPLYGYLKKSEYSKEELLDIWEDIRRRFDIKLKTGEKLKSILRSNGNFTVTTSAASYKSNYVVLALGRRGTPRKLGVPGENLPKVNYKLIDAESYQDEHVLVVGGGDSAIEAAVGLANQSGNKVSLSYRKDKFFRIKKKNEMRINEYMDSGKINVFFNSNLVGIKTDRVLMEQNSESLELKNDYVFVFAGGEPPFKLLKEIGISFGVNA